MTQEPISKPVFGPGSVITGATYPFRALWLFVKTPALRPYVLAPIGVNLIVGITLYAGLLTAGFQWIDAIITAVPHLVAETHAVSLPAIALPAWLHWPAWAHLPSFALPHVSFPQISLPQWNWPTWLTLPEWHWPDWVSALPNWIAAIFLALLRLVLSLLLLLVTGFILLQFGVLLGAPWYGKLSEELEKQRTGSLQVIEVGLARDVSRAILYELKKLVITIGLGLPLLLCNLVPGVGTAIATVGGITLAATIVCLDFFDSPLERRRLRFRQKLGILCQQLPASASFGLICLGLVSVPLINLLAIPICVAAGTLFVCDRVLPTLPASSR